jgi:polyhydroxyalkanoate synthesis regulator phasin
MKVILETTELHYELVVDLCLLEEGASIGKSYKSETLRESSQSNENLTEKITNFDERMLLIEKQLKTMEKTRQPREKKLEEEVALLTRQLHELKEDLVVSVP